MTVLLWQVLFYYPCIVPDYRVKANSWYKVKVFSLPLAPEAFDNSREYTVSIPYVTSKYSKWTC